MDRYIMTYQNTEQGQIEGLNSHPSMLIHVSVSQLNIAQAVETGETRYLLAYDLDL